MRRLLLGKISLKVALAAAAAAVTAAALGVWLAGESFVSVGTGVFFGATAVGVSATLIAVQHMVIRPLRRLNGVMARAERGDFLIRAPVDSNDELGELARQFNVMLAHITDMAATQIDTEREKALIQRELDLTAQLAEKSEVLARKVKALELLIDVSKAISSTLEIEAVLAAIRRSVDTLGFKEFALLLYEPEPAEYVIHQASGFPEGDDNVVGIRFHESEGIISLMHERRDTLVVPDVSAEPRYLHYKGRRPRQGSVLLIPIKTPGRMLGALSFARPDTDAFEAEEVRLLETVAAQATLAINNARLYQRTNELNLRDPLTGLLNRRALTQRLDEEAERSRRFEHPFSVLLCDVDHFKAVNDAAGNVLEEEVLRQIGEVIQGRVRRVDAVARLEAETFAVVLVRTGLEEAMGVAHSLREAVAAAAVPCDAAQRPGCLSLSVGVAAYPDQAGTPVEILARAKEALEEACRRGRDRAEAWAPSLSRDLGNASQVAGRGA